MSSPALTPLEQGLAAFIQSLVNALEPAPLVDVVAAVNKSTAPGDRTVIVCLVNKLPHDGGDQLYRAQCRITVESPADVEAVTVATHSAMETLVSGAFTAANYAALQSAITTAAPGWQAAGLFVDGWQTARADSEWQPYFDVTIGIVPSS